MQGEIDKTWQGIKYFPLFFSSSSCISDVDDVGVTVFCATLWMLKMATYNWSLYDKKNVQINWNLFQFSFIAFQNGRS